MTRSSTPTLPHSWTIATWPASVFPGEPSKARYLVRAHKDELRLEGALVRVGRELVIIGERYGRWLQKKAARVPGYECAANRNKEAAA